MRKHAIYSGITNWMRMIFMSILPLLIIVFFNFKVYKDVKERSQRSFERKSVKIVSSNNLTKVDFFYLKNFTKTFVDCVVCILTYKNFVDKSY